MGIPTSNDCLCPLPATVISLGWQPVPAIPGLTQGWEPTGNLVKLLLHPDHMFIFPCRNQQSSKKHRNPGWILIANTCKSLCSLLGITSWRLTQASSDEMNLPIQEMNSDDQNYMSPWYVSHHREFSSCWLIFFPQSCKELVGTRHGKVESSSSR